MKDLISFYCRTCPISLFWIRLVFLFVHCYLHVLCLIA